MVYKCEPVGSYPHISCKINQTKMKFFQVALFLLFAGLIHAEAEEEAVPNEEMLYNEKIEEEKYDSNKQSASLASYDSATATAWKVIGGFARPFHIHITCERAYVTEYGSRYVQILNLHGARLGRIRIPSGNPTGIFVKGNKVLVTTHRREIYIFSTRGELLGVQYAHSTVGIALDYNDLLYVTEWGTGRINVFNRDGTKSHTMTIGRKGILRKIFIDDKGNIYVGDHFARTIYVFNKSGTILRKIRVPVSVIEGIYVDKNGYIYVADRRRGQGKVVILRSNGSVLKTVRGLVGVSDVFIAPNGRFWIIDYEGNRIVIY